MQTNGREEAPSILKAVLALGRRIRAERPEGAVTLSALSILGTLNRLGPIPASRLAAEERLQPQSVTRVLATLEKDGHIARTRSAADRREIIIALTERGRSLLMEDIRARRAWLEDAMEAALSASERELLFTAAKPMLKLAFHDMPERVEKDDHAFGEQGWKAR
jgi:DNA-binding MarR family transcriptional regulator